MIFSKVILKLKVKYVQKFLSLFNNTLENCMKILFCGYYFLLKIDHELANYPITISINKVLLKHGHIQLLHILFIALLHYTGRGE